MCRLPRTVYQFRAMCMGHTTFWSLSATVLSYNDTLLFNAVRAGVGMGAPGMWWAEVRTALTENYPL